MAKMSSTWVLMTFVIFTLTMENVDCVINSTAPTPTADISTNATKNVFDGFFQNLLKMVNEENKTTNWSPKNITEGLNNFLTGLNIPKMFSGIFSTPHTENSNPVLDILGGLLPNVSLPKWLMSSPMANLDMYRAMAGFFAPQNSTGLMATVSRLMSLFKLYTPTLMASVTRGLQGMNISESCTQHTTAVLSGMLSGKLWALQCKHPLLSLPHIDRYTTPHCPPLFLYISI